MSPISKLLIHCAALASATVAGAATFTVESAADYALKKNPAIVAARLRSEQKADLVVCLSHGGVQSSAGGSWVGEDVELARQVPDIDVVIGGHSHTPLPQPLLVAAGLPFPDPALMGL